ncbi:putative leucine-rich repeat domain, L domain-containing protein [Rosa chinensis]|uniref:Putative leucine-rich repeat domain, L domain-containing protein n=2 Tax=Rosa chinensis TaxID=74649 RepID=A0A2P6P3Q0_ROSCH|nr:putative leucine-rich repeat domain, L domain-containing protein [Rosa chinensis]
MVSCEKHDLQNDGHLGPKGLQALGNGCPKLSRLMFCGSKVVGNAGVDALFHSAHNLKSLYLSFNDLISDPALRAIGSSSISALELVFCDKITDVGLGFLANGSTSKTIKKLVLVGCPLITDIGGVAISAIQTLKVLRLNDVDVSDHTMVALAKNCSKIEILDLEYCERVTGAGIRAFSSHKCLKLLALFGLSGLYQSDMECIALGCPSLESVVTDNLLTRGFELMQENTRRVVKFKSSYNLPLPRFSTTSWY